jgi:hypothetical protein
LHDLHDSSKDLEHRAARANIVGEGSCVYLTDRVHKPTRV